MTRDVLTALLVSVTLLSIQRDKSVAPDAVSGTPPPPRFCSWCDGGTPFPKLTARAPHQPTRVQLLPTGEAPHTSLPRGHVQGESRHLCAGSESSQGPGCCYYCPRFSAQFIRGLCDSGDTISTLEVPGAALQLRPDAATENSSRPS